jgi:hypothetical protein
MKNNGKDEGTKASEKLEEATKTLEKESLFFRQLMEAEGSARVAGRIVLLAHTLSSFEVGITSYLSRKATTLFDYKPDRCAAV